MVYMWVSIFQVYICFLLSIIDTVCGTFWLWLHSVIQKPQRQILSAIQKRQTCNFSAFKITFVIHCQSKQGKTSMVTLIVST